MYKRQASTSGGYISFADGTSGSQAYRGLISYQHSDDSMRFGTDGGTERLRITSSGQIGINSTIPAATLDIHDLGSTGPNLLLRGGSATEGDIVTPDGEALGFGHWNYGSSTYTERFKIASDGDVGISTSSPRTKLHVSGPIHTDRFFSNPTSLDTSITFPESGGAVNGGVFGPYTIASGVTLTIASGSTFKVL